MSGRITVRIDRLVVGGGHGAHAETHAPAIAAALLREAPALRATAGPDAVARAVSAAIAKGGAT